MQIVSRLYADNARSRDSSNSVLVLNSAGGQTARENIGWKPYLTNGQMLERTAKMGDKNSKKDKAKNKRQSETKQQQQSKAKQDKNKPKT